MKTYRYHYCDRKHRSYNATARCLWKWAYWVYGEGPYASLACCRGGRYHPTVMLYPTLNEAMQAQRAINETGCGGACRCDGSGHEVIEIAINNDRRK